MQPGLPRLEMDLEVLKEELTRLEKPHPYYNLGLAAAIVVLLFGLTASMYWFGWPFIVIGALGVTAFFTNRAKTKRRLAQVENQIARTREEIVKLQEKGI